EFAYMHQPFRTYSERIFLDGQPIYVPQGTKNKFATKDNQVRPDPRPGEPRPIADLMKGGPNDPSLAKTGEPPPAFVPANQQASVGLAALSKGQNSPPAAVDATAKQPAPMAKEVEYYSPKSGFFTFSRAPVGRLTDPVLLEGEQVFVH